MAVVRDAEPVPFTEPAGVGVAGSWWSWRGRARARLFLMVRRWSAGRFSRSLHSIRPRRSYRPRLRRLLSSRSILSDLVLLFEPSRQYAVSEFEAGAFSSIESYGHLVRPFIDMKLFALHAAELRRSVARRAGLDLVAQGDTYRRGCYLFFRLDVAGRLWSAAVTAWRWAVDRFLDSPAGIRHAVGDGSSPWTLLAVDAVRRPSGTARGTARDEIAYDQPGPARCCGPSSAASGRRRSGPGRTCMVRVPRMRRAGLAIAAMASGWVLGVCLASPQTLAHVGGFEVRARTACCSQGEEGAGRRGTCRVAGSGRADRDGDGSLVISTPVRSPALEGPARARGGLRGTLGHVARAPAGVRQPAGSLINIFWLGLGFFGLTWLLDVLGSVTLWRLPGLNMMSHTRSASVRPSDSVLACVGLDAIGRRAVARRRWFWARRRFRRSFAFGALIARPRCPNRSPRNWNRPSPREGCREDSRSQ